MPRPSIHQEAVAFAEANVVACCNELLEKGTTGQLKDGRLKELVAICQRTGIYNPLGLAEEFVKQAAINKVANMKSVMQIIVDGDRNCPSRSSICDDIHAQADASQLSVVSFEEYDSFASFQLEGSIKGINRLKLNWLMNPIVRIEDLN
ncbi:hypothetical protein EZI54_06920 [Marinobacter halodurans]|uniref:Uncharacterized protein n=1 Tax=Marinobacter halodurans TaxID=2528979 RepID=A0ABY1ZP76_9GAMM|nr:hypothetical protein [Marinobacter halodurans]TBW57383.1 hypothetical protein EZI54_06920 [Marinobacter halodurans]